MTVVNYWSHLPHVRTDEALLDFGPGRLWQVPFDVWNHLTAGAFSDHRRAYEATAPVFLYVEADVDWPILRPGEPEQRGNIEAKKPTFSGDEIFEEIGLGFLTGFVDHLGWAAQAALTLAAPTVAPGSPRMSMTLCAPDDGYIDLGHSTGVVARVQGDADHEWLLMPEAAGESLDSSTVHFASELFDLVLAAREHSEVAAALDGLMIAAQPTLDRREQSVISTIAIESLLMPEARTDLAATFRHRLGVLLEPAPDIERVARILFGARSAALHGHEPRNPTTVDEFVQGSVAQRVLAAAILAILRSAAVGVDLEELRSQLDDRQPPVNRIPAPYLERSSSLPGSGTSRLEHSKPSPVVAVFTPGGVMHSRPDEHMSWSPLIGLEAAGVVHSEHGGFFVDSLDPNELMELEERDIRRDFMSQVTSDPAGGPRHAVIGLQSPGTHDLAELRIRRRDAVLALRLAGFWRFVDPALLGWYIFDGTFRTRIPTVLRQSVMQESRHAAAQTIDAADGARVDEMAALVADFRSDRFDSDVDDLLSDLLQAHPNGYLPGETSAALLLGLIEATLGRFRPSADPVQLEDLVAVVADDDAATWFRSEARDFRNAVAHGRWKGTHEPRTIDDENRMLTSISCSVIRELLRFTVDRPEPSTQPIDDFAAHVTERAT